MINISYNVVAKEGSSIRTASGIYGINSGLNNSTKPSSSNVQSDNIKAMTVTTNYLTVSSAASIPTLNSSTITTNSINSTNANLSYITTYSVQATEANINSVTSLDADIKNLVSERISVKDLDVTGSAHFFELVIDKLRSAGGQMIFSAGDGFTVDKVEFSGSSYYLYWRADDGEKAISNNMQVDDLIVCRNFNEVEIGTYTNVKNKYYWCPIVHTSTQPELKDGLYYHYVVINPTLPHDGTINPEIGDEISMLGNLTDKSRQSAIYIAAGEASLDSGLQTPLFAQYQGINGSYWDLKHFRKSFFDRTNATFVGNFTVTTSDGEKDIKDYIDDEIGNVSIEGIKGDDGISSYNIVFDNQMTNIPCDYLGQIIGNTNNVFYTINAQIYYGATLINPSDISNVKVTSINGLPFGTPSYASITSTGVSINIIAGMLNAGSDCQSFMLTATLNNKYNSTEVKDTFYINKIKAGENGVTSPIYEFSTSTPYVKVNKSGDIISPSDGAIRFSVNKIYNNEVTKVTSLPDGYKIIDKWGTQINFTGEYGQYANTEDEFNYSLYRGDILVDYIEFPVLIDGKDGINGINGNNGKDGVTYSMNFTQFAATVNRNGDVYFSAYGHTTYVIGNNTYDMSNYTITWSTNGELSGSFVPSSSSSYFVINEYLGNYKNSSSAIGTAVMLELRNGSASGNVVRTETTNLLFQPSASLSIDNDLNTITATVKGNSTAISNNYKTLSNNISSLQVSMNGITSDVSSIETNMDKQTEQIAFIQNNYSTVEQTSKQIQSTVSSIRIGGENILDRTEFTSMSAMTNSDESITTKFTYDYRSIEDASIYVSPASSNMYDSYTNVLVMYAQDGTSVGTINYMDVTQSLTGKLKPNTNYVLHCKYRGYYFNNALNKNDYAGSLYITNSNSTWIETDGVTQTVLPADLHTKLYDTDGEWVTKTIKFKTGATLGTNIMLYIRTMIGSEIQICHLKLEEGTMPTAWCLSQKDTSSQITQTADSISLEIKNGLESTGIHIDEQYITLDGNTKVIGNLNIHNSDAGIVLYDNNDNPTVQIQPTPIGDLEDAQQSTVILPNVSLTGTIAVGATKTSVLPIIPIGDVTSGDVLLVSKMLAGVLLDIPYYSKPTLLSCTYKFEYVVLNSSNTVQSVQYTTTGKCYDTMWSIPEFTTTTSGKFGIRISLTFMNKSSQPCNFTASTQYLLLSKRISKIIKIGYDGMYSSFNNGSMFWVDENNIQLRQNVINSNGLYTPKGLIVNNEYDVPMIVMGRQVAVSGVDAFDRIGPICAQHNNTNLQGDSFQYVYDSVFNSFGWKSSKWTGTAWQSGSSGYNYVYDVKADDDIITITSTQLFNINTFDTVNIVPYIRLIKNNTEDVAIHNVMVGREITVINLALTTVYIVSCRSIGFAGDVISSDAVNSKPHYNIMGTGTSTTLSNRIELAKGGVAKFMFLGNGLWKRII